MTDFSMTLTTAPVQVLPDPAILGVYPHYQRVFNASATIDIWCSRYDPNPAPNKAGSFRIGPLLSEEFGLTSGFVPARPLYAVAASGSVPITAERY